MSSRRTIFAVRSRHITSCVAIYVHIGDVISNDVSLTAYTRDLNHPRSLIASEKLTCQTFDHVIPRLLSDALGPSFNRCVSAAIRLLKETRRVKLSCYGIFSTSSSLQLPELFTIHSQLSLLQPVLSSVYPSICPPAALCISSCLETETRAEEENVETFIHQAGTKTVKPLRRSRCQAAVRPSSIIHQPVCLHRCGAS